MGPMKWLMETRIENQVVPSRQAGTMEKGRTPESWREVFCGRWLCAFSLDRRSRPGKNCRVAHVRRAPLNPEGEECTGRLSFDGLPCCLRRQCPPPTQSALVSSGLHPSSSVSSASGPAIASTTALFSIAAYGTVPEVPSCLHWTRTRINTNKNHQIIQCRCMHFYSPTAPVVSALQRNSQGHARPDRGIVQNAPSNARRPSAIQTAPPFSPFTTWPWSGPS